MLITSDIQLFQILREKLGDKEAEVMVSFVNAKLKENNEHNLKVLATKKDIANLLGDLRAEISNLKTDMIKWMVTLFIAHTIMMIGLYFKK